jgi:hypothetical protein
VVKQRVLDEGRPPKHPAGPTFKENREPEMPKYDVEKVARILKLVQDGKLSQQEIARQEGVGVSSIQRYLQRYLAGELHDVDVGEILPKRVGGFGRTPSGYRPGAPKRKDGGLTSQAAFAAAEELERVAAERDQQAATARAQALGMREAGERLKAAGL